MSSTAKLQLHTNDKFKKTIKSSCTVKMNNGVDTFNEFVTFGHNDETDEVTMIHNADAITLGKAAIMAKHAFIKSLEELTPKMREEVLEYLEGVS